MSADVREARLRSGDAHAWRLDIARARVLVDQPLTFRELGSGPHGQSGDIVANVGLFGDFVLARKDAPASYHLSVVVDDALQGVTLVTRGNDLFAATNVHRLLQALLSLSVPRYGHHRLILDAAGKRLAKRDQATALRTLREQGVSAHEVRARLGFTSR
jgi:glutamyl-Q tRNA(Asp) synthetase